MKAGPVLRFLGNGAGLKEVGKVGSVSRVREIRTDVEDILPSAQIGQRGPIFGWLSGPSRQTVLGEAVKHEKEIPCPETRARDFYNAIDLGHVG